MFGKRSDGSTEYWEVKLTWVQPPSCGCKSSCCIKHSETHTHTHTECQMLLPSYPRVPTSIITILYAEMAWYFMSSSSFTDIKQNQVKRNKTQFWCQYMMNCLGPIIRAASECIHQTKFPEDRCRRNVFWCCSMRSRPSKTKKEEWSISAAVRGHLQIPI